MGQNFFKHFMVIGAGTAVNMIIGFFTVPLLTRIVPPSEFGLYSLFTAYANLALGFLCLGMDQSLVRFFYEEDKSDYKKSLLRKCLNFPVKFALLTIPVILILRNFIQIEIFNNNTILFLFFLEVLGLLFFRFGTLLLRLGYKSSYIAFVNIMHKLIYVTLALALLELTSINMAISLMIAILMAELCCVAICMYTDREIWNLSSNNNYGNNIKTEALLSYGLPLAATGIITVFSQTLDRMFLNYYCTYDEIGIYASAITLTGVFSIVQATFTTIWAPMAVEHYTKQPDDKNFYVQANQIITVIMFFMGFSIILLKDVYALLLGSSYRASAALIPFLMFNPIMFTISETTVYGINFMKKTKASIWIAIGMLVINLMGSFILIPMIGYRGAAVSMGITYIVFWALRTYIANKYFYIDFKLKNFYVLTTLLVAFAFYNTFYEGVILNLLFYIISVIVMIAMYQDTVRFILKFGFEYIKNILKRKTAK